MTEFSFAGRCLITAGVGLAGTFLVLTLIFVAVKLMQKLSGKKAQ